MIQSVRSTIYRHHFSWFLFLFQGIHLRVRLKINLLRYFCHSTVLERNREMAKPQKMELFMAQIVLAEFGLAWHCVMSVGGTCHRSGDVPPVLLLHVHIIFHLSCSQTRVTELACRGTRAPVAHGSVDVSRKIDRGGGTFYRPIQFICNLFRVVRFTLAKVIWAEKKIANPLAIKKWIPHLFVIVFIFWIFVAI